jgi:DNA-binding response OmpR family regulator
MRIIIAENQPASALLLRRTHERLSHEVTVASDGIEARRLIEEKEITLVISVWMMPGIDGLEM